MLYVATYVVFVKLHQFCRYIYNYKFSNYCSKLKKKTKKKNLPHNNFLQSLSTHSKRRSKRKNPLKSPLIMKLNSFLSRGNHIFFSPMKYLKSNYKSIAIIPSELTSTNHQIPQKCGYYLFKLSNAPQLCIIVLGPNPTSVDFPITMTTYYLSFH